MDEVYWRKKIELENEKNKIYHATVWSSQFILNNCLNQMIILKEIAKTTPDFSPAAITLFDDVIDDATHQIEEFSNIKTLNEDVICNSVLTS